MSTIVMSAVWPLQGMSPAQKAVLVSLADQANDDGVCWPSVGTIAMRTCLSERAVQAAIKWLVSVSILRVSERSGRSTYYTVTPAAYAPPQEMHPRISRTPAASAPSPAFAAPPPPQMPHPTPADAAPITVKEPSIEPSMNRKSRKAPSGFDPSTIELPDWLERFDWVRWCKDRAARGKKLTEEAVRLQLRFLDDLRHQGHSPASVIDHSIANGYQGLFAPKGAGQAKACGQRFDPVAYLNNRDRGIADDDHRTIDV